MYAKVYGETTCGINGEQIIVEVDISNGLPSFDIVGLPDTSVKESRERVRAALKNSGLIFPMTRITVNLAPADLKKDGSGLDLPIAVGILVSSGVLQQEQVDDTIFVGELALDGTIRQIAGVLPMILHARDIGRKNIVIPAGNCAEGRLVDGIDVLIPASLLELVEHLRGEKVLDVLDKEAICAAGGHNILMVGSPGSGKTMLARRLPTILPPLTEAEALEVTKIYSIAGLLQRQERVMLERPFRSPHHTISSSALIGGGSVPRPGEVTLSHHGVLFLDEFPEFSRTALEVLRQPLEDGYVTISRVQASLTFPANFIMCTAQNPCPCGYLGDKKRECSCKQFEIERYHRKLSGPLLDRIDLQVYVPRLEYADLQSREAGESSAVIRERVIKARQLQLLRLQGTNLYCNAQMGRRELNKHCQMEAAAEKLLAKFFTALGLSARSHDRIIKVARTIADLDGSDIITAAHLAEAVQLRTSLNS